MFLIIEFSFKMFGCQTKAQTISGHCVFQKCSRSNKSLKIEGYFLITTDNINNFLSIVIYAAGCGEITLIVYYNVFIEQPIALVVVSLIGWFANKASTAFSTYFTVTAFAFLALLSIAPI